MCIRAWPPLRHGLPDPLEPCLLEGRQSSPPSSLSSCDGHRDELTSKGGTSDRPSQINEGILNKNWKICDKNQNLFGFSLRRCFRFKHTKFSLRPTFFPIKIAMICVTKSRIGNSDFRACARARGFPGSTRFGRTHTLRRVWRAITR